MLADGVLPSNDGPGYVLRRLLRRAVRFGKLLGFDGLFLNEYMPILIDIMGNPYRELITQRPVIEQIITLEEEKFNKTLKQGTELFDAETSRLKANGATEIPGDVIFTLYDTYGFPPELTREMAGELGFTVDDDNQCQTIFINESQPVQASNINGYLIDAPNVWIESRNKPLCDVPEISMGNQPIDNGLYLFSDEEKTEFVKKEHKALPYFHRWFGADEFINNKVRWCLWLGDCSPSVLRSMPLCYERAVKVREYRLGSNRASTVRLADSPTRFQTENMPKGNYIVIPEVSSEKRRYVPIGYMDDSVLCSNKLRLMPNASHYEFGVLTSNVHNAWMRTVCGRLETRYDYSIKIVYNNFPWPNPTEAQKSRIEQTAQAILDARAKYPDCSLADLYDETAMPHDLRKAHKENDKAVMQAYGFASRMMADDNEAPIVAELFKLYQALIKQEP